MPAGAYELGIAVQDRQFYADGQLYYPPEWVPEFFGDVALVNGKIWPKLDVEPRKYRIHLPERLQRPVLEHEARRVRPRGQRRARFGARPGLLHGRHRAGPRAATRSSSTTRTTRYSPRLLIGPGDRRDLIIDFAGQQGKYFLMHNNASAPFDGTFPPDPENPLPELFLFYVKDTTVVDKSTIPMHPGFSATLQSEPRVQ